MHRRGVSTLFFVFQAKHIKMQSYRFGDPIRLHSFSAAQRTRTKAVRIVYHLHPFTHSLITNKREERSLSKDSGAEHFNAVYCNTLLTKVSQKILLDVF